jgi:hypothetical protein
MVTVALHGQVLAVEALQDPALDLVRFDHVGVGRDTAPVNGHQSGVTLFRLNA